MATEATVEMRVRARPGFVSLVRLAVELDRLGLELLAGGCWRLAKRLVRVGPA